MIDPMKIVSHMDVVDAAGTHVGTVDAVEWGSIKLAKFDDPAGAGTHHWVPLTWVTAVDQRVTLDRDRADVMREWLAEAPGQ